MKIIQRAILAFLFFPFCILFADSDFAYVGTDNGTLLKIDTKTNSIIGTVTVGGNPIYITITPNFRFAYVVDESSNIISVVNTETNTLSTTIDLTSEGGRITYIAISPDGQRGYATNYTNGTITIISTKTNQPIGLISGFSLPVGIAITPSGKFGYVAEENQITVVNLSSNTIETPPILIQGDNNWITTSSSGEFVYVATRPPTTNDVVSVISTATNKVISQVILNGSKFYGMVLSPDDKYLYLSDLYDTSYCNIDVFLTPANLFLQPAILEFQNNPSGSYFPLGVTLDGQTIYCVTLASTSLILVVSTETKQVIATIPIPGLDNGLSIGMPQHQLLISDLSGRQIKNNFGTIYEYFNHIEWDPSADARLIITSYNIYRNGQFLANVPNTTFEYNDHNQEKGVPVVYSVVGIDFLGNTILSRTVLVN